MSKGTRKKDASKEEATAEEVSFSFVPSEPLENERHEMFCVEYIRKRRNGIRAYQHVYPGTTYQSAGSAACRLLKDDKIRARIDALYQEYIEMAHIDAQTVLAETSNLAMIDPANFYDAEGNLIPIHLLPRELSSCIKEFKSTDIFSGSGEEKVKIGTQIEYKLYDRYKGLELLGKRLEVFKETLEVKHSLEDMLHAAANGESE